MLSALDGLLPAGVIVLAGAGLAARAQEAPVPPHGLRVAATADEVTISARDVKLEELLIEIGNRFGVVIVAGADLSETISVELHGLGVPAALARILDRRGYLLAYREPWPGPLAESPNRLWIAGRGTARTLNADRRQEPIAAAPADAADPIARIDEVIEAFSGDAAALVAELSVLAQGAADETVREEAVHALAELHGARGLAALERALSDPAESVRRAVVLGLGASKSGKALAMLERALADASPAVREEAVYALADIGGDTAMAALERAMRDADAAVREAARDVLLASQPLGDLVEDRGVIDRRG